MVRPAAKRSGLGSKQEAAAARKTLSSTGADKDVTHKEILVAFREE